ncbi:MAG: Vitamin B12 dependent methionine synthase activation subunit [Clostridia bacterium]|nr:Vitamin B12 dependent methionine synthase activation subunit [Clostridia bacterium]
MIANVAVKNYPQAPIDISEAIRYAGGGKSEEILLLANSCAEEINGKLRGSVCYVLLDVEIKEDVCDFGVFRVTSENLAKNLCGAEKVILFGATVGVEIDRLIAKYSKSSQTRAVMLAGLGAERIEALCDSFCADMEKELNVKLKPRFSPGYGDLDISMQREIFRVLDCPKRIGLCLTESMLMTPSKSVTAFVGII